ncbi:hypothetical protein ACH5RR_012229 [Cinchona calisaya]|uniref:Uncharacterized protein n=1 Tax=Cinchona calisaya TaxID=153742 RepID=A0ABD3A8R4_9GENT
MLALDLHEIVGVVTEVGSKVQKFKVGYIVGVGCLIGSCRTCEDCADDLEKFCPKKITTYDGPRYYDGTLTFGGYSDHVVVDEHFAIHWPEKFPLDGVGLGGLGHVAVKFAEAFGAKVTVISTSPSKKEALKEFGADSFLVSHDPEALQAAAGTLHGILDTVFAVHPILPLHSLLKNHANYILLSPPEKSLELPVFPLLMGRKLVAGSSIGGIKENEKMLSFAAEHGITADVEVIPIDYVNTAIERLAKNDVRYRFVNDVGNTLKAA